MLEPRALHHRNVQPNGSEAASESTIQILQSGPISQAKHTWFEIQQELPPQITRRWVVYPICQRN